jgi:phage shock protein PspC (stress-responsive transcriptional regulator)
MLDAMSTDSDTGYGPTPGPATDDTEARESATGHPPLRRPIQGRMLAGVAAGLAQYFGVDVAIIRVGLAALAILGIVGSSLALAGIPLYLAGIPLYLACWILIPEEGEERSIAGAFLHSAQGRTR